MMPRRAMRFALACCVAGFAPINSATAQQVHVLIVNGLAGESKYRAAFDSVATQLADSAKKRWNVADSSLIVLTEDAPRGAASYLRGKSTRAEVALAFTTLLDKAAHPSQRSSP